MKKLLYLWLIVPLFSFAVSNTLLLEKQIIASIVHEVVPKKKRVKVFFYGDKMPLSFVNNDKLFLVKDCHLADLIIVNKIGYHEKSCLNVPIITLDYSLLEKYSTAIGAYFWQKGRPNIVMIAPRLKKEHIVLSSDFSQYIEERVW